MPPSLSFKERSRGRPRFPPALPSLPPWAGVFSFIPAPLPFHTLHDHVIILLLKISLSYTNLFSVSHLTALLCMLLFLSAVWSRETRARCRFVAQWYFVHNTVFLFLSCHCSSAWMLVLWHRVHPSLRDPMGSRWAAWFPILTIIIFDFSFPMLSSLYLLSPSVCSLTLCLYRLKPHVLLHVS